MPPAPGRGSLHTVQSSVKTGNGAQALTLNVDTEAPHLGMGGDPVSFSGYLSAKGSANIQGKRD